jgi:tetratricopeptide (TPR) repeat protein
LSLVSQHCAMRSVVLTLMLLTSIALVPAQTLAQQGDRQTQLDQLFAALKVAPTEQDAADLENRIKAIWGGAATPAVSLLLARGQRQLAAKDAKAAEEDFNDALILEPDLLEAYNARALARFQQGDLNGAVQDIEQILRREPRNFAALQNLSMIAVSHEDWAGAYAAWQKVMEIDPKTPGGEARLKDLKRRALGDNA